MVRVPCVEPLGSFGRIIRLLTEPRVLLMLLLGIAAICFSSDYSIRALTVPPPLS